MIVSAPHRFSVCLSVTFSLLLSAVWIHGAPQFAEFIDPNPNVGNGFGKTVVALSTGNVVITSPSDDLGGTNAGAVYLFNGATGSLISTLRGGRANSQVGSSGVTALPNGNFLIHSPNWGDGTYVGAVTFVNGVTGISGVVSSSNSLVGRVDDRVGAIDSIHPVTVLSNGNYVLCSSSWDNGTALDAGAVTWGSGTTGVSGVISSSNSLIGTTTNDRVGNYLASSSNGIYTSGVVALSNGNYVVMSPVWDNSTVTDAGAVTWASGTTGVSGVISGSNSLVGSTAGDRIGNILMAPETQSGLVMLGDGNYAVASPLWDHAGVANAGAVTWGSGTTGVTGVISGDNSLIGSTADDKVGMIDGQYSDRLSVTALRNGNYVVATPAWDSQTLMDAGAVTWGSAAAGVSGFISSSNSLVGTGHYDHVGIGGVTALTNGHYVVCSPEWAASPSADSAGAVTWGNGLTGISGTVSASNSLVGTHSWDEVGGGGITVLSNGHYLVFSLHTQLPASNSVNAVTWCDGTVGRSGMVSQSNSLFGSGVGSGGIKALRNGNYVVITPGWDGVNRLVGAVTWGNGATGTSGAVSSSNSLVGTSEDDSVGKGGVTELSSGNYVVVSPWWRNAGQRQSGAVTWASGTSGVKGSVSASNSLVGTRPQDYVGEGGVKALSNGNYVVASPGWNNGQTVDAGAVTWGNGVTGVKGVVSSSNSLVGSSANDKVGRLGVIYDYIDKLGVVELANGNYVVCSTYWNHGGVVSAGAVTWGSGTSGVTGTVGSSNSLVGQIPYGQVGQNLTLLSSGGYVVGSSIENTGYDNPFRSVLAWGRGTAAAGATVAGSSNSLLGVTSSGNPLTAVEDPVNKNYLAAFPGEGSGKVRVGSQWDGLAPSTPDISVEQGGPLIDGTGSTSFGPTVVGSSTTLTFTITNCGTTELGGLAVSKDGTDADEFTMGVLSGMSIPVGNGTVSFTVTFSPSVIGVRTAVIHVASNVAGNKNPFDITLTGTGVSDNANLTGLALSSGTLEPAFATDVLAYAASVPNTPGTVVIQAVKAEPLASVHVRVNGGSYYSVSNPMPLNVGVNTVDVRVTAQDGTTMKTYTVVVTRDSAPEISVTGQGLQILDGDNRPPEQNSRFFGSVPIVSATRSSSFVIYNTGTRVLQFTGTPRVRVQGTHAADFRVSLLPAPQIETGSDSSFEITFDPHAPGMRVAEVCIESDDEDEGTFNFAVSGMGRLAAGISQTLYFSPPSKVFMAEGGIELDARSSSTIPIEYSVISGPAQISFWRVLVPTGPGVVKVRASQPGDQDHLPVSVERTITVAKDPTIPTLSNLTQVYTGFRCPPTVVGAQSPMTLLYEGKNYGLSTYAPVLPGTYVIRYYAGGASRTANLVITKAPLFVIPHEERKLVGQPNPPLDLDYVGFFDGDNASTGVSVPPEVVTTATASSPGGLYPITARGGVSAKYQFVYQASSMKVETFASSYEAMLTEPGGIRPTAKLEVTVAATGKTFSAKLSTSEETTPLSLAGTLSLPAADETTTGTATVKKGTNTYLVTVTLPLTGDFSAEAKRNGLSLGTTTSGRKLLTPVAGQTLSYTGTHSALLAPVVPGGVGVPAGAGWAVATIDAKGLLKLAGKLADGTTLTASLAADIGSNPGYRLFIQPYTPARTGSYLAGVFSLKSHPDLTGRRHVSFEDAIDFTWRKTLRGADASYRNGFGPLTTRLTLDPWLPPAPAKGIVPAVTLAQRLGLNGPLNPFNVQHSAISSPSFGDLPASLALNAKTNAVSVTESANATKWKVTITPTTGAFVGSFELNDTGKKRSVPFTGIMRQPPSTDASGLIGDGHFLLPSLLKAPDNVILSGEVGFERMMEIE
ncbi:MAG: choice-of-anchor D domain-containing protein [Verrucomicrobiota bacterium]